MKNYNKTWIFLELHHIFWWVFFKIICTPFLRIAQRWMPPKIKWNWGDMTHQFFEASGPKDHFSKKQRKTLLEMVNQILDIYRFSFAQRARHRHTNVFFDKKTAYEVNAPSFSVIMFLVLIFIRMVWIIHFEIISGDKSCPGAGVEHVKLKCYWKLQCCHRLNFSTFHWNMGANYFINNKIKLHFLFT